MNREKMFDFVTFVAHIKSELPEILERDLPDYEVGFDITHKVNGSKQCIRGGRKNESIMKNIYFDELYEEYIEHGNIDKTIDDIISIIKMDRIPIKSDEFIDLVNNPEKVRHLITYFVINKDMNEELLNNIPHRSMLDLAIVYKITVSKDCDSVGKVLVTNDMVLKWGLSEQELFDYASNNTERMFSTLIKKVTSDFIIVTNECAVNGAAAIINKDLIRSIAEDVCDDIYIVPSSIHDLIVLKKSLHDADSILSVINHVNNDVVNPEDILSYNLYCYSMSEDEIAIV